MLDGNSQPVDPAGEVEKDLVVLVVYWGAGVRGNVKGLINREYQRIVRSIVWFTTTLRELRNKS